MNGSTSFFTSIILLIILFFISRLSLQRLFHLLHRYINNNNMIYVGISILLFPGTIIHELSHAIMAMILQLKIHDIHIFPEWKNGQIKLGSVSYVKKDVFRSILVGVAPLFVGILALWWLYSLGLYNQASPLQFIFINYIVFVISTTMFSSKQDMVDIIYAIPVIILIGGIIFVFQIDSSQILSLIDVEPIMQFMYAIRAYLMIAIGIHTAIILFATTILALHKKP